MVARFNLDLQIHLLQIIIIVVFYLTKQMFLENLKTANNFTIKCQATDFRLKQKSKTTGCMITFWYVTNPKYPPKKETPTKSKRTLYKSFVNTLKWVDIVIDFAVFVIFYTLIFR